MPRFPAPVASFLRRRLIPAAGLAVVVLFAILIAQFRHPVYGFTAFFQVDPTLDDTKVAAFREHPVYVYPDVGAYDGCFYSQLAVDPTLRDRQFPVTLDNPAYRARRILPAATAWLLAGTDAGRAITVYSWLNLAAWGALALLLWRVLKVTTVRAWLGWTGMLLSAGALSSVRLALTDLIACLLLAFALRMAEEGRKFSALAGVAAAGLTRETGLLGVAGLIKRPWISWKNVARVALATLPLALWLVYVYRQLGPSDAGARNFTLPLSGWVEKSWEVLFAFGGSADRLLVVTSLLAHVGLTAQVVYLLWRPDRHDRWWRLGFAHVLLMVMLGQAVWEGFPGAATRVLLPLALAFNVLAVRRRAAVLWLVIGNLGVGSGLLALRDVPDDPREIAAARLNAGGVIVRLGDGFYNKEAARGHAWSWTSGRASLHLEAWPRRGTELRLRFGMRSLTAREVVLRHDGREIWRARVGERRKVFEAPVTLYGGTGTLTYSTDQPPVPENPAGNGRDLAFALYDVEVLPAR